MEIRPIGIGRVSALFDCGSRKGQVLPDKRGQWVSQFYQRKEQERTRFWNEILERACNKVCVNSQKIVEIPVF
ncbi:MAG: hypothetical protein LBO67_02755 [Spirochaetaceae bacterium]|nr:hypothetical protein [Spirochaetaceae bacterium]